MTKPDQGSDRELEITLPMAIGPWERAERFESPLWDLFEEIGGEVVGGGTLMGHDGTIAEVVIEVIVSHVETALPRIVEILRDGGAPEGTAIVLKPERKRVYP
jgi:hypothetical protein